ncbi:MAG: SRPBCC family protein [Deltaproteobacteria bacterium]|nr:SRPBCC family protein [Deltaproteobacteria bacterium]
MKLKTIHKTLFLPISIQEGWKFFSNPRNLTLITPPSLGLEITSEVPDSIYPGVIITYRVRPFLGISVNWITEITHMRKPFLFVDEQRFGPYKFWHHKHLFKEVDGGIVVEDLVHYALPFGPLGNAANRLMVSRELDKIFTFRRRYLTARFGSQTEKGKEARI